MKYSFLFLFIATTVSAQELIQNDFEKGYVQDGKKISVWQYFNDKKEVELSINHSTGRVMYVKADSSDFIIYKDGHWVSSKLSFPPIPITGYTNFYLGVLDTLKYPLKDYDGGLEGRVTITFDVDTTGVIGNVRISKGIGGQCDSTVIKAIRLGNSGWIPARIGTKRYSSRFQMSFEFRLNKDKASLDFADFAVDPKNSFFLRAFIISKSADGRGFYSVDYMEKSAEYVGGMSAFYKWLAKNMLYPPSARRMGLEGKVFVEFIIEPDGSITNVSVKRGFDGACDREAVRVTSIMPKWKPGTQNGRPVRQSYTMPITFKLAE